MPVKSKKINTKTKKTSSVKKAAPLKAATGSCCTTSSCRDHCKKIFGVLFGILLVYVIVLVGTMIRNNINEYSYIGQADRMERTILVQAEGKVTAKPDIAVTTMGMIVDGSTVAEAQQKNTSVMNSLNSKLKVLGISEDDIQTTNYNIYPQYDYLEDEGRVLNGYQVSQSVNVKIRNLEKANQVLALAGEVGANSVSGLEFTIDDRDIYKNEARDLALQKIGEKARMLSQSLGVRIIGVVSYDEYEGGENDFGPYRAYAESGFGGDTPVIESGSMDVKMNLNVTFEIR